MTQKDACSATIHQKNGCYHSRPPIGTPLHMQRIVLPFGSCYIINGNFGWQHPKVLAPRLVVQSSELFSYTEIQYIQHSKAIEKRTKFKISLYFLHFSEFY